MGVSLSHNLPYVPTEYSVKPGLRKLEDEPHFIIDDLFPLYKNEKQDARAEDLEQYYIERQIIPEQGYIEAQSAQQSYLMKTITFWMAEQLSKQYEQISFESEDDGYVFHSEFTGESVWTDERLNVRQVLKSPICMCSKQCSGCKHPTPTYTTLFDAICSQIQEDVCVMQNDELVSAHVCLPSWWSPREKMGMSMGEIHADVPGMDKTAYEHIWKACLHKGPYLRYNWTLTDTPILNQHPSKNIGKDFNKEDLFLRVERQVLQGFPSVQGVMFLIRTYVADIKTLEKSQREAVANAIDKMSDEELKYKGLTNDKESVILRCINYLS